MRAPVSVIGTGYLGATQAAALAELGHDVLGVDINDATVQALRSGRPPFYEPRLEELLARHVASGRLRFGSSIEEAAAFSKFHLICVGTPQREGERAADVSAVFAAVKALAPALRPGSIVIGKSTVPAGTAPKIAEILAEYGCELVWNPEFLREGFAIQDSLTPDRIVLGASSDAAVQAVLELYDAMIAAGVPVVVTDFATAELVKVAANSFLATKISFINAMAEICEPLGADVTALSRALSHDPRIGAGAFSAGLGFGGGCLPKDIRAFTARADELGLGRSLGILHEVEAVNDRRRERMVGVARRLAGGSLAGRRIAILGASFKPGTDDVRDSPALEVGLGLQREGADVHVYDPRALARARASYPTLQYSESVIAACADADVVLHLTEWPEFRGMKPADLSAVVRQRAIADGRNVLDAGTWRAAGWTFSH
jgi:UDPglucose 6-dehydrogenase